MTSKEALKKLEYFTNWTSDENIDKDLYNLWGNVACRTIKQDLERLEEINKVWHKNEVMESVDINAKHLQELYDYISKVNQENEKLKKAIENEIELLIERRFNSYACDNYEVYNVIDAIIEELKEVLGNE